MSRYTFWVLQCFSDKNKTYFVDWFLVKPWKSLFCRHGRLDKSKLFRIIEWSFFACYLIVTQSFIKQSLYKASTLLTERKLVCWFEWQLKLCFQVISALLLQLDILKSFVRISHRTRKLIFADETELLQQEIRLKCGSEISEVYRRNMKSCRVSCIFWTMVQKVCFFSVWHVDLLLFDDSKRTERNITSQRSISFATIVKSYQLFFRV